MKIGFDLDRIFIDFPPFVPPRLIDWLYKRSLREIFSLKDHCQKDLAYSIPKSPVSKLVRRTSHISPLRPPIKKNIKILSQILLNPTLNLYLISSRYQFLEKLTYKLLHKYDLMTPFAKIFLNTSNEQPHLFKEKILKKLNLDLFIDDDLDLLRYLQTKNLKTKLLWYNPSCKNCETHGIDTVTNLAEIIEFIK
ncbi:MAG: hypothetical protein Q7R97_02400 [Candidatus Daviesbacteria bacterium]|nr:hypothetical protein [Candidatus Daviesbacteria bacterium]